MLFYKIGTTIYFRKNKKTRSLFFATILNTELHKIINISKFFTMHLQSYKAVENLNEVLFIQKYNSELRGYSSTFRKPTLKNNKIFYRLHLTGTIIFIGFIFFASFFCNTTIAQFKTRLSIKIIESDTRKVTPAMVCITNLETNNVHLPPDGEIAGQPTYPDVFFNGVKFNQNKNWIGPVRKMSGKGEVNGQRTYVYGLAPTLPYWSEPVMYQTFGDFFIDLQPGKWRISIQHGNEYIPAMEEITVTAKQKKLQKIFYLKRWINLPRRGWYSGDVHAHHPLTTQAFRDYTMQLAKAEDVHLLNILQMGDRKNTHFQPEGFGKQFRIRKGNTCIVSGQEEPRSDYGHIIGLNIQALARDTAHYNQYDLVFNKIKLRQEALIGFAHFAYNGEGVKEGLAIYAPTGAINFVELLQNTKLNTSDYYDYLNLGFRLTAAAGSDFPWGSTIGDGRTMVYTGNPFSADKWFAGMKAGNTFVTNGPALFLEANGSIPGTEISLHKKATVMIKVKAISNRHIGIIEKIELHNNDGLVFETKNEKGLDSIEISLSHKLLKSQWLTAAVYCSNGALAHTSPLYFIVDGKPTYDVVKGPGIINKLLAVLEKIKTQDNSKQIIEQGVFESIEKAKTYYQRLKFEMLRSANPPVKSVIQMDN